MEKAKNDIRPRRSLIRKFMLFVGLGLFLLFGFMMMLSFGMLFFLEYTRSGEFIEELPLALVPTADYLLKNPLPTPEYLSIDRPETHEGTTGLCVRSLDGTGLFRESRFFVNGARLPGEMIRHSFLSGSNIDPRYETPGSDRSWACIDLLLTEGIHLIGFQPSVFGPKPIHEWVIEIKN